MTQLAETELPRFRELNRDTAVVLVTSEDPVFRSDHLPGGWTWTGEIIDYVFEDGDWAEVYVLWRNA